MYLSILAVSVSIHVMLLFVAKTWDRFFAGLLLISHIYFCVGGYYYWIVVEDGHFVGSRWMPSELLFGISVLSVCTTAFCALGVLLRRTPRFFTSPLVGLRQQHSLPKAWWFFGAIGLAGSLLVMVQIRLGLSVGRVAYQLSDCLIPALAFYVAARGLTKEALIALTLFAIYASIVGLRYKIALVAIPVLACVYYSKIPVLRKVALIGGGTSIMLALFTALTLFRRQFSGVSFDGASEKTFEDLLYGLFAESNIIFGLSAVNTEFLFKGNAIGLVPLLDSFKEWVPRSLYPTRVSGEYLTVVGLGLYTEEGSRSATAYPYIGEYIIMFGWVGILLAAPVLALVYRGITNHMARHSLSPQIYAGGVGVIVSLLCYYNYSRGYLPQISKAYICVLLPYVLMVGQSWRALAGGQLHSRAASQAILSPKQT